VKKKWYTLDQALTWVGSVALIVLFVPTSLYLTFTVSASVEQGLIDRGQSFIKSLVPQLVEPILWEDSLAIHEILHRVAETDTETKYLFVEHAKDNRIDGHSQDLTSSPQLVKLWEENRNQIIRFRTQEELLIDISTPILDGQLGFLHIGLSRSNVAEAINRLRWVLGLALIAAIIVVLIGARIMSAQVSRPLHRLEKMVSRFPQHSLGSQELRLSKIPDLNSLGKGFQEMALRIETLQKEQNETQKAMIRTERLAAVGELTAGLAHEICNPLDGMLECLRYLETDPDKSSRAAKYYPMLLDGFQRIESVMGGMLTFTRSGQNVNLKSCSLSDILENLKLLLQTGNKGGTVSYQWYCEKDCACLCDPQGLSQACLNLILNATEAAAQSTHPMVRIIAKYIEPWICVSVEDSGPGVSEELQERIFDTFFTTKPVGKGTGLGLSVSRQIISAAGGELGLSQENSQLGGARFIIQLRKG